MASLRRLLLRRWVPYVVLAIGLALTSALTLYVTRTTRSGDVLRFQTVADETQHLIDLRLNSYVELLRAGAALFAASDDVTPQEFTSFVAGLRLPERYQGLQGIGFAPYVTREALTSDPMVALMLARGGHVWPEGDRPAYTPVVALEPADQRNLLAVGYDMYNDPVRRAAMDRARDTGEPAASAALTPVPEVDQDRQRGFLIYMPVYRVGAHPATVEERRRTLVGFVYSPFRGGDLLQGLVGPAQSFGFSVYAGDASDPANLLHAEPLPARPTPHAPLESVEHVDVAGREWTIVFTGDEHFDGSSMWLAPAVFAGGLFVSLALFGIMRTQLTAWSAAARHAADLRSSEEALRETGDRLRRLVTLEREARAEAQRADHAKDEFLATLSHELRTPLNAMLGWLSMLRSGKVREERRAQALEVIERNARTQARLIEDLLDVSRIITGKIRLEVQPVALPAIVRSTVEGMRPTAESKDITLRAEVADDAPAIMGDGGRLQQIVWNLLSNAVKFTPPGGEVHVVLGYENGMLRFSTRDTGIGISPEFLPHVFERFRQADSSTTRTHGGVGLGLAIARHLIELHGGSIEAHSDGVGHGALFVILLPIAAHQGAARTQDAVTPAGEFA